MKMRHLSGHKVDDIPDHLLEEVNALSKTLSELLMPIIDGNHPNIVLASFNFMHAALIKHIIVDDEDELMKATLAECKALASNIKLLIKIQREKDECGTT